METTTSATGRKRPAPKGRRKTARDLSERDERGSICSGNSCGYRLRLRDGREHIRANNLQVHPPGVRDAFVPPLTNGLRADAEHPRYGDSSAEGVDCFGIAVLSFHAAIVSKLAFNCKRTSTSVSLLATFVRIVVLK